MGKRRLYLIDATAFCYRAFYALGSLSTSFGQPTNAIYGFVNMLNKILKDKEPELLAACFDVSRDTFRQKKFAEYKIHRPPMPDSLLSQIPFIKEIVSAYGITILEKAGYEADDIIATMVKKAKKKNLAVTVISSDKDMLQLVDKDTLVFSPYKDQGLTYDSKKVFERFGVEPKRLSDIIALMGDDADNIPGVSGIGEKTAVDLIKNFGSLDNLLSHLDQINKEKLRSALKDNINQIKLSRQLALLDEDIGIDSDPEELKVDRPKAKELFRLFKHLEFKSFLKELPAEEKESESIKINTYTTADLKKIMDTEADFFLYGDGIGDMYFYAQNEFFKIDKDCLTETKAILANPKIKKVSCDLKKIKISLAKEGILLAGLWFDVMLAAYLLDPSKGQYQLADLAWSYLDKYALDNQIDNEAALRLIVDLAPKLKEELCRKSLMSLFQDIEMPLIEVLADMELNGIRLDTDVLRTLSKDIEKKLIKLIEDIHQISGTQFNINSPKQLREVLFERLKLPVIKKSKTGPSTDEEVLRKLSPQHKLPALLLEYRQLMKLKTTYIDVLPEVVDKKTGRIHASFNQAGTETGRLSSSNPNLQNIPIKTDIGRKIRRAVIASGADNLLLSCDYSQIELRILAHLSKDSALIDAFKQDRDIHKATASLIYGLEEKEITHQMRETAKRVNFGIIYGLTSFGLSRDLNIGLDEAAAFIDAYFLKYARVKEYIQEQIEKAQKEGFVTTILGRRRYLAQINDRNPALRQFAQRQAANTPIQGSASDLIKLAMIKIHAEIKTKNLKAMLVLQIHDELVFDVPKKEEAELIYLVRERMENGMTLDVPIRVEIKKGKNWLEMEAVK